MTDYSSYLQGVLRTANQGHNVQMCLLKKTASKNDEKRRKILKVEVDDEVLTLFKENLIKKCSSIINDTELNFIDFFSEDPDENIISVIEQKDMEDICTLIPIISQIKSDDDSKSVTEFKKCALNNLQSYAISMSHIDNTSENKAEETCIYFRKYQVGSKIAKSKFLGILEHKKGKFNKIEGDVFKYDDIIDAIYYERVNLGNSDQNNSKIMFVRNLTNFEEIFSFEDFYKLNAKRAYDALLSYKDIEIKEGLFEKIICNKRYLKKICALNKENFFTNIGFDRFFQIYNTTSSLDYALNLKADEKKVQIKDERSFFEFIDICSNKLYGDLVDDKIYKGIAKELPKKSI